MRSFRMELARRMAGSVLLLAVLLVAISVFTLRTILYAQLDETLVHLAEVEGQAGAAHTSSQFEFHEGVLLASQAGTAELTRYAQLWSSEGQPLVRSANLDRDLSLPEGAVEAARAGRVVLATHTWSGERLRCVIYPLQLIGAVHEMHVLQVAAPLAPLARTLRTFLGWSVLLILAAAALAFLVGWRVAGRALRPTQEITAEAQGIREGTAAPAITAHGDVEEFTRLVQVLNAMLRRLENARELQRRFTADASHELRGPLTALRGELDLALRRERSPEEYRTALERCRGEVIRLTRLATDLLTLAGNDAGLQPGERTEVDLRALADHVVERYQAVAAERGIALTVAGPTAVVEGDVARLERVIGNLVDNAVKHSPAGGTVTLTLAPADQKVVVTVADQGPGVPPADQPNLFNRFFRGTAGGRDGTGLGLAIAQSAAVAHGGRLEFLGNAPGAVFRLVLPALRARS